MTPLVGSSSGRQPLLEISDLRTHYPIREGLLRRVTGFVRAVDGVDIQITAGETFGIVGESGSGKTTLGKAVLGLAPVTTGEIRLGGKAVAGNIAHRSPQLRRSIQVVFQDVSTSLNPRRTVGGTIADPLRVNGERDNKKIRDRVRQLLDTVELPVEFADRYPHELSGGERQRVGIARALAVDPKVIVLDEPTSALDVSVQAKIVELLGRLQRELGLTYILISHDLALVRTLATNIGVMYLGRMMEVAPTSTLFEDPRNPYSICLLTAIPTVEGEVADAGRPRYRVLPGDIPNPAYPPIGCPFQTRCPARQPVCAEDPGLRTMAPGHASRCWFDAPSPVVSRDDLSLVAAQGAMPVES